MLSRKFKYIFLAIFLGIFTALFIALPLTSQYLKAQITSYFDKYGCDTSLTYYCSYDYKCKFFNEPCWPTTTTILDTKIIENIIPTTTTDTKETTVPTTTTDIKETIVPTTTTDTKETIIPTTTTDTTKTISCPPKETICYDEYGSYCSYNGVCNSFSTTTNTSTTPQDPNCDAWDPFCKISSEILDIKSTYTSSDYIEDKYTSDVLDRREINNFIKKLNIKFLDKVDEIKNYELSVKQLDRSINSSVMTKAFDILAEMNKVTNELESFIAKDPSTIKSVKELDAIDNRFNYLNDVLLPGAYKLEPHFRVFKDLVYLNSEVQRTLNKIIDAREKSNQFSSECNYLFNEAISILEAFRDSPLKFIDITNPENVNVFREIDSISKTYIDPALKCKDRVYSMDSYTYLKNSKNVENIYSFVDKMVELKKDSILDNVTRVLDKIDTKVLDKFTVLTSNIADTDERLQDKVFPRLNDALTSYQEMQFLKVGISKLAQKKLDEIFNELLENHWTEETSLEVQKRLKNLEVLIRQDGTEEEIYSKLKEIYEFLQNSKLNESKKLFEADELPWEDIRLNDWHASFDYKAKKSGIMKGDGASNFTKLRPDRKTIRAEAYAMVARSSNLNLEDPSLKLVRNIPGLPDWAFSSAAALQKMGIKVVLNPYGDAAGDITRGEAAKLVTQVLGLKPKDLNTASNFKDFDLINKDPELLESAAALYEYGIITGYGKGSPLEGQFGVNESFLRSELAKVIVKIIELKK